MLALSAWSERIALSAVASNLLGAKYTGYSLWQYQQLSGEFNATSTKPRGQTTEAFAAHLALVGKDVQAWVDLFAENAVVEFPYASTTPGVIADNITETGGEVLVLPVDLSDEQATLELRQPGSYPLRTA